MTLRIAMLILLFAMHSEVCNADNTETMEIERATYSQRMKLLRGELQVSSKRYTKSDNGSTLISKAEYSIAFDGDQIRFDQRQFKTDEAPFFTGKNVQTSDRIIFHSDDLGADGKSYAVSMGARAQMSSFQMGAFDPRRLGILPFASTTLHAFGLETFLTRPDRIETKLSRETVENSETWHIEYTRKDGMKAQIWIVPSMDFSVVRAQLEGTHPKDGVVVDRIVNSMKQYQDGKVWFPSRVLQERLVAGKVIDYEEVNILEADFNHPVPNEKFTLAGMRVPAGTHIFELPADSTGTKVWDGSSIVSLQKQQDPFAVEFASAQKGRSTFWVVLSANLAVLAIILLYTICEAHKENDKKSRRCEK